MIIVTRARSDSQDGGGGAAVDDERNRNSRKRSLLTIRNNTHKIKSILDKRNDVVKDGKSSIKTRIHFLHWSEIPPPSRPNRGEKQHQDENPFPPLVGDTATITTKSCIANTRDVYGRKITWLGVAERAHADKEEEDRQREAIRLSKLQAKLQVLLFHKNAIPMKQWIQIYQRHMSHVIVHMLT